MPLGGLVMALYFLFVLITGAALLVWGWRSGQFKNIEEAKYPMLYEREPEPWPGREDVERQRYRDRQEDVEREGYRDRQEDVERHDGQ